MLAVHRIYPLLIVRHIADQNIDGRVRSESEFQDIRAPPNRKDIRNFIVCGQRDRFADKWKQCFSHASIWCNAISCWRNRSESGFPAG